MNDFSGIWLSNYVYHSSSSDEDRTSQHYMRILQEGDTIVFESIPELNDSYMVARFTLDDNVATGSWQEVTDTQGEYKGAVYHGAAQMIIADDRKTLEGKWVGFGKQMEVKTGPWTISYVAETADQIQLDQQIA
jgi:hypothetical protein